MMQIKDMIGARMFTHLKAYLMQGRQFPGQNVGGSV